MSVERITWRTAGLALALAALALAATTVGAARAAAPAPPSAAPGKDAAARPAVAPSVLPADLPAVKKAIEAPGAAAVLVNVWATWCDPCREEMPELLRLYREHRARGVRLVLISADDEDDRDEAARFLGSLGVDFPSWLKRGDDMAFIDGLDRRWTGALPASFLYDGRGRVQRFWQGEVTAAELDRALKDVLANSKTTKAQPGRKTR